MRFKQVMRFMRLAYITTPYGAKGVAMSNRNETFKDSVADEVARTNNRTIYEFDEEMYRRWYQNEMPGLRKEVLYVPDPVTIDWRYYAFVCVESGIIKDVQYVPSSKVMLTVTERIEASPVKSRS
jgi:hypothetical protein